MAMTLADLLRSGKTPEEINALLSGSTITSGSLNPNFMAGEPYAPPQEQPVNSVVNSRTGRAVPLLDAYGRPSQSQGQSQALDYSSAPVEFGGMKGYRVKGDPFSVVMADGRVLRLGADTGADRKRMTDDLAIASQRQKLNEGNIDEQIKRAQLAELMGMDPAQMGGIGVPVRTETPGFFPETGARPSETQQQASVLNQKMLTRRFGNAPAGHRWDAQGTAIPIPGIEKPLTEFQGKSANFGGRAAAAHEIITNIGDNGNVQPGAIKRVMQSTPYFGEGLGTLTNWTQSAQQQQVEQAQRDFVNAVLRQESGAAIAESEFNNAQKQYFPQPGDTPDVILQKKRNREQAIAGFAVSAGEGGKKLITSAKEKAQAIFEAHKAIKEGKDKAAVKQRLESYGITDHGIK